MQNDLNDSLDDLLGGPVALTPREPARAPEGFKPREFTDTCPACKGRGRFVSYAGRDCGPCFKCKGAGKQTFKTSPETRAKTRAQAAERKTNKAEQNWADFAAAQPPIAAWIAANPSFGFAASLRQKVEQYGDLLPGAVAAVERLIEKDKARATEAAARTAAAPQADTAGIDRLKLAFDTAKKRAADKGLSMRTPRITVAGITISPAKADSPNAGALYVKCGSEYMGKIQNGRFLGRNCPEDVTERVLSFIADPKAAAEAYGQTTGVCCVCNATLKSAWKLRGIGPVCAEKMGWDGEEA